MKIYCDSSTREACYVVEGPRPVVIPYSERVTVNVGEYRAVILALEEAKRLKLEQVEIYTDSLLVVNQVSGNWKCQAEHLIPLRDKVRELLKNGGIELKWIPRERNIAGFCLSSLI